MTTVPELWFSGGKAVSSEPLRCSFIEDVQWSPLSIGVQGEPVAREKLAHSSMCGAQSASPNSPNPFWGLG